MVDMQARPDAAAPAPGREATREAQGASQIGPFDYCPKVGFREYWYPGLEARRVGRRPVRLTMLGEELVFFRDRDGRVVALDDWCPHRGARLSWGVCEFRWTVTCPYHGYVFDGSGQCVAGLVDGPASPLVPKLRARKYPTAERHGLVFVWLGETAPVPLDADLPAEFRDPALTGPRYLRNRVWEANWTEPMAQAIDLHDHYLHRNLNFWRLFDLSLRFFRPKPTYSEGFKILDEGENFVSGDHKNLHYGQAYYPGLDARWPRHVWWRRLPPGGKFSGQPWVDYTYNIEMPSKIRVIIGASIHMRWMVPINEDETRVWTFTIVRKPKSWQGKLQQDIWYYGWRLWESPVAANELEDLVVFKKGRLNLERPQKLGPLDAGLIYFRRHLARRSRDFRRLGGAWGCLKAPPGTFPIEEPAASLPRS